MFEAIGKIFKPEKLTEGVVQGVDKLFYTKEEKAANFTTLLKLYEPFKLAQRLLAFLFSTIYIFNFLVGETFFLFIDENKAQIIWQNNNDTFSYIVLAIITFYFTGGVINPAAKRLSQIISKRTKTQNP